LLQRRQLHDMFNWDKVADTKIWKINRYVYNVYKQEPTNISKWVTLLLFFKQDVPRFLEVDYSILTCIVLCKPRFLFELSWYVTRFINFFLLRQYSWRYVT
jgi:hypothetical protein